MKRRPLAFRRIAVAAAAATLAASTVSCRRAGSAIDSFPDAPIVLISIDTLRSDHLPAYGYDRIATPAIDRLRRDGVLFESAWSAYPLTVPSHVTILSGLLPTEHGVRDNIGYRFDAETHFYLPRILHDRGFATGGAVSTWLLRGETGLRQGFDFYEDNLDLKAGAGLGESQRRGSVTVDRALEWLAGRPAGDRFFLFVHLYEPHTPYDPPEPFRSRASHPYDGEILAADALVGRLLDALAARRDYERSTIVLLSDHGEGLGDHGEAEHGILLYREALQVPLLLKLPGRRRAGATVDSPAHLADVAPTLAALAGAPIAGRTTLVDLLAGVAPPRDLYAETYYPRLHFGWSELTSLVRGPLHYIEGPDPELYDLAVDGRERHNLSDDRRRDLAVLRQALAPMQRDLAAPAEVDREAAERLASLGYLSARNAPASGPALDPKAEIHVLADLDRAHRLAREKRFAEALAAYRGVVAQQPGMTDAWEGLAYALLRQGDENAALAAYTRAMELTAGSDHIALAIGRVHLGRGEAKLARQHAELALQSSPAAAHSLLAEIALATADIEGGEREARAALETSPNHLASLVQLARIAVLRDRLDEAQEWVAKIDAERTRRGESEPPAGFYFVQGDLAARLGDEAAAIGYLEREIREHSSDSRAYTRLAVLHALGGRPREAVAALRRLVEENETPAAYAAAVETLRVLGDEVAASRLLGVARVKYPEHPRLRALERPS